MTITDKTSVTSTRWIIQDGDDEYEVIHSEDWDDGIIAIWIVIDSNGDELEECELRDQLIKVAMDDLNS